MEQQKGILLESGTNELEIVEFNVGGSSYGINVIKVKEILMPVKVTAIPHSHKYVEGIIELRGEVLPVVCIADALGVALDKSLNDKFIVTEFNKQKLVFRVSTVTQIHRISWEQIEKPSSMYQGEATQVTGVVQLNGEMILLLDFEKIVVEINPSAGMTVESVQKLGKRSRSAKNILIAEDSPLLRKLLNETLTEAGYENLEFFENGQEALEYLLHLKSEKGSIEEYVQLVITDIEMPKMDGHHFTKRIKQEEDLQTLPVIIFSSLITNDLLHKGKMVGADAQVSKPEIRELVAEIDKYVL
ncbi:response regulator [Bacillus lacus]|uniref:Response regulator n=1 Tax=Metabacillus lacus TaxID=1983721 RepID=A0A7X2J1S3_9BACI|nr:chemotaxis protein [Metabacillus lacus]MRX73770.1 response regulator [Metabacillus lacus]